MHESNRSIHQHAHARTRATTTDARGGRACVCMHTVVFREIETAVPDERILVLFVPYILLTRSYNIKVNIFGLNEVKIEIESPGAALCTCLVPNLYSLRYPKWYFVHYHYSNKFHYIFQIWCYIPDYTDIYYLEYGLHWLVQMQLNIFRCTNVQ